MAKELGHQRRLALDCGYWRNCYRVGSFRCTMVVEQACAVEVNNKREEGTVDL